MYPAQVDIPHVEAVDEGRRDMAERVTGLESGPFMPGADAMVADGIERVVVDPAEIQSALSMREFRSESRG